MVAGPAMASYRQSLAQSAFDLPGSIFEKAEKRERDNYERILRQNQGNANSENVYRLHQQLGDTMLRDGTIERDNATLDKVLAKLGELDDRAKRICVTDTSPRVNQGAQFVRHFENMLVLARRHRAGRAKPRRVARRALQARISRSATTPIGLARPSRSISRERRTLRSMRSTTTARGPPCT